ncbi:MAG: FAD-binding and (Fe-S)-binding domain-containing protein [Flavobacteriaceae bacterium]|nr:FAD-binding and (Fe-S)-binding domain-containing protein [Flavobacteriaceae bacterium]
MDAQKLEALQRKIKGTLHTDHLTRVLYATDASVYRKIPDMVCYPKNFTDIKHIIEFAHLEKIPIIPRTAGTSLAGQCVGGGIIVDVSRNLNKIGKLDLVKKTVTVQPGVIRDALNDFLRPHGLFFGPNTSTSNRCMIGGMVGNNSSGTTSIKYGVTRDKVLKIKGFMPNGSPMTFEPLTKEAFFQKAKLKTQEGLLYQTIYTLLSDKDNQKEIAAHFPDPAIHRRNTGYAIDALLQNEIFAESDALFNFSKLLAGSEGTLFFSTEITLQLDELPPEEGIMVAAHFRSISDCMKAVVLVMQHELYSCEMLDKVILDCTKNNREQLKNRFFIEGDPEAILMLELRAENAEKLHQKTKKLLESIIQSGLSYANPVLQGGEIKQAEELRKAGLGLLGNMVGDKKAVACIEDTAVNVSDLPEYIDAFTKIMASYGQDAVYYAHAGAGELHLRPILNLKVKKDVAHFKQITAEVAALVKRFKGSFSGEHGDGIVRSSFIPMMVGEKNYEIFKTIKKTFDPQNLFNPGKIVDASPMDQNLRYQPDRTEPNIKTLMDFSDSGGILRVAEKCNGSGDCRKLPESGGTMCPSYRATRMEKDTTRARANALREYLTQSVLPNRFDREELKEVFDLCLSCKACASECPSNVDIAALKAEFLYQYQKANGISWQTKAFAYSTAINRWGYRFRLLTNFLYSNGATSRIIKKASSISKHRSLPKLSRRRLASHIRRYRKKPIQGNGRKVLLFVDEFTDYLDASVGVDAIELLRGLGYNIQFVRHSESGRAFISKGLLDNAKKIANRNVKIFSKIVSEKTPLLGVEPSAILTFRDEYLRLADDQEAAKALARHVYLIEEFLQTEMKAGHIKPEQFTDVSQVIKIHGHCHQKALSGIEPTFYVLNFPKNFSVTIIPSGCCGMAGSFGYEEEHFEISMRIGEQTLFPAVRKSPSTTIIAASGTSCRHQIYDGTAREALHPVTILRNALI